MFKNLIKKNGVINLGSGSMNHNNYVVVKFWPIKI